MREASYTPCEVCEKNPDRPPVWQITADKVTYFEDEHRISYHDAKFEIFGTPIAWTPYFSHPDGTIKQKSGFLTPHFGYDSELGAVIENNYYWAIAPDKDLTFGAIMMTEELPVMLAEYRQRWSDAMIELEGSITESSRNDRVAGKEIIQDDEVRGHFSGTALWNINDLWRAGFDLELTSDDQYLRQYDFSSEDVLENELYLERFSGRNYAAGRLLAFQDVRVREERVEDQPNVLPEVVASFYGEPDRTLGGRWHVEASALGLHREGNEEDVNRAVLSADWERRFVSDTGLVANINVMGRGDVYNTRDRNVSRSADSGESNSVTETRSFGHVHTAASYPVAKPLENAQIMIEPKAALTLAPKIDNDDDIPNEDSQDVQIDANNLFEPNRFPGLDKVEDGSHATYGVKTGVYGYGGSHADVFVGQSYRFDDDNNPFPRGSGLSRQESDIVGQLSAKYKESFGAYYRFQTDSDDFTSQRHEVDSYAKWRRFDLQGRYLYARALEGTEIDDSREQVQGWAGFRLTDNWRIRSMALHDLGSDPGLRKAELGLDYLGQCVGFSGTYSRELTSDASGDSGTEIMFTVSLKNLGEFKTSAISIDSDDNEDDDEGAVTGEEY
jgi:LPS-assembly protein